VIDKAKASVIAGHGLLMLGSVAKTTKGARLLAAPFERLLDDVSDQELGAAVLRMLEASGRVIEHPPAGISAEAYGRPFVQAMGFQSAQELFRGAKSISVRVDEGKFVAFPSRGDADGTALFTGEVITSPSLRDSDIGQAVREAIGRSGELP
jgi:hypothetical protein